MKGHRREVSVATALISLLAALAIFAPSFYQPIPLLSLAARSAPALLVTGGMALVIIAKQIDISVGSQFAVCGVCAGVLLQAHWPWAGVLAGVVITGLVLGAINGLLVASFRLPSIVVTLATMVIWREGLRWQRQGQFVNLPAGSQWFGLTQQQGQIVVMVVTVLFVIALGLGAKHLALGRYVYAVGSNVEAARLAGLRPRLITGGLFAALGVLCAVAALLNSIQSPQVDPNSGNGLELRVIAAAVVGGIAISGGRGHLWGAAMGLVLLACIGPALTYLRLEAYWERAVQGAIILLAVMGEGLQARTLRGATRTARIQNS